MTLYHTVSDYIDHNVHDVDHKAYDLSQKIRLGY